MNLRTSRSRRAAKINSPGTHETALGAARAVDVMLYRYVCWREECAAVNQAYQRWSDAPRADREPAYRRYLAALTREEHAAGLYQRQLGWVSLICT
jgi:hypothetical protein